MKSGGRTVKSEDVRDQLARPLRDLRISVTDRCNFRCRYCMPAEIFGPGYQFLPRKEVLSFEEILQVVRATVPLGGRKIRLTGGEPLLRRGLPDFIAMLSSVTGVEDIALTTNGVLLTHKAEALALAGLNRVTVSLDALDPEVFAQMNGVGAKVDRVLAGIRAAQSFGLPVKVNAVIQRGVNEDQILPLARWGREQGVTVRFIEYMDVGETNGWGEVDVVSAAEIMSMINRAMPVEAVDDIEIGAVATRYRYRGSRLEVGVISSVTKPFCGDCQRIRLSADGKLFTCLFAAHGHDIKSLLRRGGDLQSEIADLWTSRTDRYSELRGKEIQDKVEMSYLGG